jgi:2-amino-4-hydroxy-6-hydroxymethyldihydropteridine diphosphokinase
MSILHKFYLSLGSNIRPEANLAGAIDELRKYGQVEEISSAWESRPVGAAGPNFLNVCLSFVVALRETDLKLRIVRPVETALGRVRSQKKDAPRPIDIDVIMMDGRPLNNQLWTNAFVVLPMAELLPHFVHPLNQRQLAEAARDAQAATWIVRRADALRQPRK